MQSRVVDLLHVYLCRFSCVDVQIVNCAGLVSKWVGDTPKNIDALFQEARATDAVLCFDEAEGLFGTRSSDMGSSTDRYAAMDVGEDPLPPPHPPPQPETAGGFGMTPCPVLW